MKRRIVVSIATVALCLGGLAVTHAEASTHPSYPLGQAPACVTNYHKVIKTHLVKGVERRYVACVYRAPVVSTTAPLSINVSISAVWPPAPGGGGPPLNNVSTVGSSAVFTVTTTTTNGASVALVQNWAITRPGSPGELILNPSNVGSPGQYRAEYNFTVAGIYELFVFAYPASGTILSDENLVGQAKYIVTVS